MKRLNSALQLAGVACLVIMGALIAPWLAWGVAGVGLITFAVIRDLSEEPDGANDDRTVH